MTLFNFKIYRVSLTDFRLFHLLFLNLQSISLSTVVNALPYKNIVYARAPLIKRQNATFYLKNSIAFKATVLLFVLLYLLSLAK